ncbi:AMP-binding domain-containing protein, partial [Haematococcus lacustris]
RTCAYYIFSRGGLQVITTIRKFRDDLTAFPPDHLVCVPLVLDTLHARVMQRLRSAPLLRRQLASLLLAVSTAYVRACRVTGGLELRYACSATPWHVLLGASL